VRTISFVAHAPLGAPFAMSMLGADERSSRAPATPTITHRKPAPSKNTEKQVSTARPMFCGFVQVLPPRR
jgi:hypothetical protein